jgi:hypothetical protein
MRFWIAPSDAITYTARLSRTVAEMKYGSGIPGSRSSDMARASSSCSARRTVSLAAKDPAADSTWSGPGVAAEFGCCAQPLDAAATP